MNPMTEDLLIQQITPDHLEHHSGWDSVYAYNNEDFWSKKLLGRRSDREKHKLTNGDIIT